MKKTLIIIVNALIMAAILVFVFLYSVFENKAAYERQIEHFKNTTVTMESVTQNYLRAAYLRCLGALYQQQSHDHGRGG